jgi:CrcB protein
VLRILLVGLAGLVGTLCRYCLAGAVARRYGETFPAGTLAVNLAGCFAAGLLFQLLQERYDFSETARAAAFVGLLGGFTTFSSYGLQTFGLLRDGRLGLAALNVVASNLLGLLLVWAGYAAARLLWGAAV